MTKQGRGRIKNGGSAKTGDSMGGCDGIRRRCLLARHVGPRSLTGRPRRCGLADPRVGAVVLLELLGVISEAMPRLRVHLSACIDSDVLSDMHNHQTRLPSIGRLGGLRQACHILPCNHGQELDREITGLR